ncbi:MAG TPA: bifunctional oligoribonuclease/PAP phosphatase NrnA [Herpetosiphonaceae bacterium]
MLHTTVEAAAAPLMEAIAAARHILVTTHLNPDGDAVGSLIGLGRALRQLGSTVTLVAPTPLPLVAAALPDAADVRIYSAERALPAEADLVILVDTGSVSRVGPIYEDERPYLEARPLLVIDHHATNAGEGLINLVMTEAASACEIVAQLLKAWNAPCDQETATALLTGILTDTQSFQIPATSPRTMRVAADLLEAGGRLNDVVRAMLFSKPFSHAKALGLALGEMRQEGPVIWSELTRAMQAATGADDEAGDEITGYLTRITGAKVYVLFKERRDGSVKISFRSLPGIDVSLIAGEFGGGGHRQACGATVAGPLEQARATVLGRLHDWLGA